MKFKMLLAGISVCLNVFGQENTSSLEKKIDTVLALQKATYSEVRYDDPLENKTFGIEINPARLLLYSSEKDLSLTGTISYFKLDKHSELAFPFIIEKRDNHTKTSYYSIDAVYRRFIGKHQNGFYLSGGMRYARVHDELADETHNVIFNINEGQIKTLNKVGAMFGIGYRFIAKSGFYWGFSASGGRYFIDGKEVEHYYWDDKILVDVEILKFGFIF